MEPYPSSGDNTRKRWTPEEDAAIHSLIQQHGTNWRAIACSPDLAGRSDDSVRNRWLRICEKQGAEVYRC